MKVIAIPALQDNYIWCIVNEDTQQCAIIDPAEAKPVIATLAENKWQLSAILITHHHPDHTHGISELVKLCTIPVYGPGTINGISMPVKESEEIRILDQLNLRVIAVPGHTLDHIAYYGDQKLFCGDALFSAGCGRLFEGDAAMMYESLSKLKSLPDETKVYCTHEYTLNNLKFALSVEPHNEDIQAYSNKVEQLRQHHQITLPSSIGLEKKINPFLRVECGAVKESVQNKTGLQLSNPVDVFHYTRLWKDDF